jgi:predicted nucleotidyltransferase component of viral defense system
MVRLASGAIRILDDPAYFRSAVNYTAAVTAFPVAPIEKDFFCTLLLEHLAHKEPDLVFKGGTALAKVHAGFYRLSEDLDFTLPMPLDSPRSARRRRMDGIRRALEDIGRELAVFHLAEPLRGANNSSQYSATVRYQSPCLGSSEDIRLDISLREPLLTPIYAGAAQTILRDPVNGSRIIGDVRIPCLSWQESWAEKFRAALSRQDVAIRDFYDIDVAVRRWNLDSGADEFVALVHRKLSTPGFERLELSSTRLRRLRAQIATELRPVLRPVDFEPFDLDRAVGIAEEMARRVREIERQHPTTGAS